MHGPTSRKLEPRVSAGGCKHRAKHGFVEIPEGEKLKKKNLIIDIKLGLKLWNVIWTLLDTVTLSLNLCWKIH